MPAVSRFAQATPWSHYLCAVVDIAFPARSVRVTRSPRGVSDLPYPLRSAETIHIITAFNPGGRNATAQANLRAQHELLHHISVRGLQWWPAVGGALDDSHAEISAAVVGMDDAQAQALGRRLGQDAVFAWSPSSWRLLACADTARDSVSAGWHAAILEPPSRRFSRSPAT